MVFNENIRHPDYIKYGPLWETVKELLDPYEVEANKQKYLLPRLKEEPELYTHRLSKFTYTPVMSRAINDLIKRLNTSVVEVKAPEDPFLELINPMETVNKAMKSWLCYGRSVWLFNNGAFRLINPLTLINWKTNREGELEFAVLRYEKYKITLDENPTQYYQFFILTPDSYQEYDTAEGYLRLLEERPNEVGIVPIFTFICQEDMWTAKSAYLKQIQHLIVENSITDASTNMYVQRVIKPMLVPDNDLGDTYVDQKQGPSSNSHIIQGDFSFTEPSGSSVNTNKDLLGFIEGQIRALISMTQTDNQNKVESAESKKMDFREVSMILEDFGHHLRIFLKEFYLQTLRMTGGLSENVEIDILGLDTFEVDTISSLLDTALLVQSIEGIPEEGKNYLYTRISEKLKGGVSHA